MNNKLFNNFRVDSSRAKFWDYSNSGNYFITICTKNRTKFFGDVVQNKVILSPIGKICEKCWKEIPMHFPHVKLDVFIVMPNHIHGILIINNPDKNLHYKNDNKFGPQTKNLASIIRGFKIGVTKESKLNGIDFCWQERYYDHIIRDLKSFGNIQKYILENPYQWKNDKFYF